VSKTKVSTLRSLNQSNKYAFGRRLNVVLAWEWALLLNEPNFTKLGEDIERSWIHKKFVSEFGCLAAFSNAGGSNLSDVVNDAKLRTFWPLWKLREVGRDHSLD